MTLRGGVIISIIITTLPWIQQYYQNSRNFVKKHHKFIPLYWHRTMMCITWTNSVCEHVYNIYKDSVLACVLCACVRVCVNVYGWEILMCEVQYVFIFVQIIWSILKTYPWIFNISFGRTFQPSDSFAIFLHLNVTLK